MTAFSEPEVAMARLRERCAQKLPYATRGIAKAEAKAIMKRRPQKRLRPYECAICGHWHLSSLPACELEELANKLEAYGL